MRKARKAQTKRGRPSVYKPEYCKQVVEVMKRGLSATAFGATVGVSATTIGRWRADIREFSEAVKDGQAQRQAYYEEQLAKAAADGSVAAIIFALKNISPDEWRERSDSMLSTRPTVLGLDEDLVQRIRDAARTFNEPQPKQVTEASRDDHDDEPNVAAEGTEREAAVYCSGPIPDELAEQIREAARRFQRT